MKKDIRFTWATNCSWYTTILEKILGEDYNFIPDPLNPDYIFADQYIFTQPEMMRKLRHYKEEKEKSPIFIFYADESVSPDMNIFDYAICFDDNFKVDDRCARIPTLTFTPYAIDERIDNPLQYLSEKTDFCNFIYSNPNAHPTRDNIFHKITEYKKVDSLGSHLNNRKNNKPRSSNSWNTESIVLKKNYKFSIAAENAIYKGYTSEKILTSFMAHSIPIYWGNPNIARDFNEKSFINCHSYPNLDAVLERIKEIDNNDDLWLEIMSQPRRTKEQIELYENDLKNLSVFLKNIFDQGLQDAQRAPAGSHTDIYHRHLFHYYCQPINPSTSLLGGLIKIKKENYKRKVKILGFIKFSYTSKTKAKK